MNYVVSRVCEFYATYELNKHKKACSGLGNSRVPVLGILVEFIVSVTSGR